MCLAKKTMPLSSESTGCASLCYEETRSRHCEERNGWHKFSTRRALTVYQRALGASGDSDDRGSNIKGRRQMTTDVSAEKRAADEALIERLRAGDRAALETVVQQWQDSLFRIAFRVLGDAASAEDVRQNVFLRLIESTETLPRAEFFGAWIRRCTVNEALLQLRKQHTHERAVDRLAKQAKSTTVDIPHAAHDATDATRLRVALSQLEPEQRAMLALRFDLGLSFQELADVLGRPCSTVKSQMSRTIAQLRTKIGAGQAGAKDNER
jgi:RNA polymerase sigma-70 factor (ECF subfamily)